MEIGDEEEAVRVEPLEDPFDKPEPEPVSEPEPVREPEKVPA